MQGSQNDPPKKDLRLPFSLVTFFWSKQKKVTRVWGYAPYYYLIVSYDKNLDDNIVDFDIADIFAGNVDCQSDSRCQSL